MLDILIRGGLVVDGTGAAARRADVAIDGERIAAIGALEGAQAHTVIEAAGCVVAPGFVDMHSHADATLPLLPTADSLVMQGVTTAVVGQCGASPAPLLAETRAQVIAANEDEDAPLPWQEWSSMGSYLDYLRRIGLSANIAPLVGLGMIRAAVMLYAAGAPSPQQMGRMQAEVEQALAEGAIGVSSGLIYAPGSYATTEELIELARPVGQRGGYYFTHMRSEGDRLLEAVGEAIAIGRGTGARVQISHLKASFPRNWHKAVQALELIERARAEGVDVGVDMYPYTAGNSSLVSMLPLWAQEGGKAATLARLADGETRRRMAQAQTARGLLSEIDWRTVLITSSPRKREWEGRYVAEIAEEKGKNEDTTEAQSTQRTKSFTAEHAEKSRNHHGDTEHTEQSSSAVPAEEHCSGSRSGGFSRTQSAAEGGGTGVRPPQPPNPGGSVAAGSAEGGGTGVRPPQPPNPGGSVAAGPAEGGETGIPALEWLFDALLETELQIAMSCDYASEGNLEMQLRWPGMLIGSDSAALAAEGPLSGGCPHPRTFGTFPRVLGRYVREQGVLSLEEAIYRMSGLAAQRLGWRERGLLRPGYAADVVVFDAQTIADRGTAQQPKQYPVGVRQVIVNGTVVVREGVHTGKRPGRVVGNG